MTIMYTLIFCDVCHTYKDNVAENNIQSDKYLTVCNTCKDEISRETTHKLHKDKSINWDAR